jgi:hypothetical protein
MSELSDKALDAIMAGVKAEILEDNAGEQFCTKKIYHIEPIPLPKPEAMMFSTLDGFAGFCTDLLIKISDRERLPSDPALVHVVGPARVELLSDTYGMTHQRTCFAMAGFKELLGPSFEFNKYYEHEEFIVGLMTLFEPTPPRAEVLKLIGTIKENQVREFGDDGVSQSVSAKAGVALVAEVQVPNPVLLRPYRTFREIEQPQSPFILRVKQGKGEKPTCALFEADGGKWKLDAMDDIADYLKSLLPDLRVIA